MLKIQIYLLNWYYKYLLHHILDTTEAMIHQYLQYPGIRKSVYELVSC